MDLGLLCRVDDLRLARRGMRHAQVLAHAGAEQVGVLRNHCEAAS